MKTENLIRRIIIAFFLSLVIHLSYGQENYLPGYLLSPNGDTLAGFIDYRNWDKNPEKIFFKEDLSDNKSDYSPNDVRGFKVLDELYESAAVQINISLSGDPGAELRFANDTVFLQAIMLGEKSLYFFRSKIGKDQYYIKKDTIYEFLVYKRYLKTIDGKTSYVKNNKFLGQLSDYLKDCPTIQSKIENLKYSQKSLENLFQYYYNCTSSEISFHRKVKKTTLEFGVLAGLSLTSLKFSSSGFSYLVNTNYDNSANFSAGLFLDVVLPRNQGKWSFYNELLYTSYEVNGSYNDFEHENKYLISTTTIGYSYLKLNTMIRFKYPIGKMHIYLNAGISNGFAISETNYLLKEKKFWDIETTEEDKAISDTRKYEQGYIVGLGTKFKKYAFEIRFENGNGMSKHSSLKSSTLRYYFLLAYRF